MTYREVAEMLENVGLPTAYYQFPEDTGQEPPFICFFYESSNDLYADNSNYSRIESLLVELYTESKDFEAEARVEAVLRENGLTWTREESALDSERMYEVIYRVEVLIKMEV